jgi:hypothetical protein
MRIRQCGPSRTSGFVVLVRYPVVWRPRMLHLGRGEGLVPFEGNQRVKGVKLIEFIRWAREGIVTSPSGLPSVTFGRNHQL